MLSLVKFAEIVTLNRLLTVMQTHFQNVSDDNSIKSRKDYGACSFLSNMKSSSWARFADIQFSFSIYWTRGKIKEIICFVFNRTYFTFEISQATRRSNYLQLAQFDAHNNLVLKQKSPPKKTSLSFKKESFFYSFRLH